MVEPTTPDVTFTVSGKVIASVELAYKNYFEALCTAASDLTAAHKRALAEARRTLAGAYQQLGEEFFQHIGVSVALANHAKAHVLDMAATDDKLATSLEARAAGGDAA